MLPKLVLTLTNHFGLDPNDEDFIVSDDEIDEDEDDENEKNDLLKKFLTKLKTQEEKFENKLKEGREKKEEIGIGQGLGKM